MSHAANKVLIKIFYGRIKKQVEYKLNEDQLGLKKMPQAIEAILTEADLGRHDIEKLTVLAFIANWTLAYLKSSKQLDKINCTKLNKIQEKDYKQPEPRPESWDNNQGRRQKTSSKRVRQR